MTTSIEMLKDRDLIYQTISAQRKLLRQALIKLYRLVKSTRREALLREKAGQGSNLREFISKVIKEAFKKLNPQDWDVEIQTLPTIVHLCGSKLEKDELVYLARDSSPDTMHITFDDFINAVDKLTQDVKLEPYQTTNDILSSLAGHDEFITLKQMRNLLDSYKILSQEVIYEIIHELKYLSLNNNDVRISNVASLVRNLIEEHPR